HPEIEVSHAGWGILARVLRIAFPSSGDSTPTLPGPGTKAASLASHMLQDYCGSAILRKYPQGRRPWGQLVRPIKVNFNREISRRQQVFDTLSKVFLSAAFAVVISVMSLAGQDQQQGQAPAAQPAQGQPAPGQPAQKNWKDRAEY